MSSYVRKNAWDANNGGQFQDQEGNYTELYWYAKAIQVMQARPIKDPTSWWFYAAIHGEFLLNPIKYPKLQYLNWVNISYIPASANLNDHPPKSQTNLFWDQCQHATWFFPPWHRGYLVALENILRDIIVDELDGPADWALPYWNYLKTNEAGDLIEKYIPPAFTVERLPDDSSNPLYVPERYGSEVQVGYGDFSANDLCQWDTIYTESSSGSSNSGNIFGYYYGGGDSGFHHGREAGGGTGDLEMNPHNFVHSAIGGHHNKQTGLMGIPATAALDPIFFLHHGNIDRMWAAWNETGHNSNPSDAVWLEGPTASGDRRFAMPLDTQGTPWQFTPADVQSTQNLSYKGATYSYTYDDLSLTSYSNTRPTVVSHIERLTKLGVVNAAETAKDIQMTNKSNNELVGASNGAHLLASGEMNIVVKLNANKWKPVAKSLAEANVSKQPDEVYLQLEDVKGGHDANFLSVYVNGEFVNSISLFGLLSASLEDGSHGGGGLTYTFNITHIIDDLHLGGGLDVDALNVQVKAKHAPSEDDDLSIGRIGIYRSGQ